LALVAAAVAAVLVLAGIALIFVSARGSDAAGGSSAFAASALVPAPVASVQDTGLATETAGAVLALVDRGRQRSVPITEAAEASTAATVTVKPRKLPPAGPSLDAYRGLGTWVDIFDTRAWNDPAGAVRDMKRHGVRTLFVETSNSSSSTSFQDAAKLQTFIAAAHGRGMRVVAWYLADLTDVAKDYARIEAALRLKTADGQRFDSFALDIESTVVTPESARNRALMDLSSRIRALAGKTYPLGAITPSPVGTVTNAGYWPSFPYASLARVYDVWVPMSYYTYHGKGGAAASRDTASNMKILNSLKGRPKLPVHLIGGISDNSTQAEVGEFVKAAVRAKVIGASLYGWAGTTAADWAELKAIK
jgi:hypothetical protein